MRGDHGLFLGLGAAGHHPYRTRPDQPRQRLALGFGAGQGLALVGPILELDEAARVATFAFQVSVG